MPLLNTIGAAAARAYGFLANIFTAGRLNASTGPYNVPGFAIGGSSESSGSTTKTIDVLSNGYYTPPGSSQKNAIFLTKYSANLSLQSQVALYDTSSAQLSNLNSYIIIHGAGSPFDDIFILLSGYGGGNGRIPERIARLDSSFTNTWTKGYAFNTDPTFIGAYYFYDLKLDGRGIGATSKLYLAGIFSFPGDFDYAPYEYPVLFKLNNDGSVYSSALFGIPVNYYQGFSKIATIKALDNTEIVYAAGTTTDSWGYTPSAFITKIPCSTTITTPTWSRNIDPTYYNNSVAIAAIKIDSSEDLNANVYLLTSNCNDDNFYYNYKSIDLHKFDSSGTRLYGVYISDQNYTYDTYAYDMVLDTSGNIYIVGTYTGRGSQGQSLFIIKLDSAFNIVWQRLYAFAFGVISAISLVVRNIFLTTTGNLCVPLIITNDTQGQIVLTQPTSAPNTGTFSVPDIVDGRTYMLTISPADFYFTFSTAVINSFSATASSPTLNVVTSYTPFTKAAQTPTSAVVNL